MMAIDETQHQQILAILSEIKREIAELRTEIKREIAKAKCEIAKAKCEIKREIADLRTEMRWCFGSFVVLVGLILAAFKFF